MTKIRPERIKDLECDEYTRFPSLAYARSFLVLYAKYLQVDISKYQTMDVGNPAGVGDYQYLQNESGVDSLRFSRPSELPPPKPILFRALLILLAATIVGATTGYFVLQLGRLRINDDLIKKHQNDDRALLSGTGALSPTPIPVRKAIPITPEEPAPKAGGAPSQEALPAESGTNLSLSGTEHAIPEQSGTSSVQPGPLDSASTSAAAPAGQPVPSGTASVAVIVPSATPKSGLTGQGTSVPPVAPTPSASGTADALIPPLAAEAVEPATSSGTTPVTGGTQTAAISGTEAKPVAMDKPSPTPAPKHEIKIKVTKKSWVIVVRDDPDSEPVFNERMSPSSSAVVLKGNRFWIKTRDSKDRGNLKITKDGSPVKGSGDVVHLK